MFGDDIRSAPPENVAQNQRREPVVGQFDSRYRSGESFAYMTHLRSETGVAGLWRWICRECDVRSRQWFRSDEEAIEAARLQHSYKAHAEVHLYGHGRGRRNT